VRQYKLTSLGVVSEAASLVQRVLPELTLAECTEFVATLASLAGSLWQIANPAPALFPAGTRPTGNRCLHAGASTRAEVVLGTPRIRQAAPW
jgi:hypothetical protein